MNYLFHVILRSVSYSITFTAKSETKQLREDAEKMTKEKGQICSQILEKQRKIASLESDSSTLTQVESLFVCLWVGVGFWYFQ